MLLQTHVSIALLIFLWLISPLGVVSDFSSSAFVILAMPALCGRISAKVEVVTGRGGA